MKKCLFCTLDNQRVENTVIDETDYFKVIPAVGSFVEGYILIVSKRHINSMSQLEDCEKCEYKKIINKYRKKFKDIYGKYPIVFEHGTPNVRSKIKANSVLHAHTHIINHNFYDNEKIIEELNFKKVKNINYVNKTCNYISYIDYMGNCYVSYEFSPTSQLMRILVAKDLGIDDKYNWKNHVFLENVILTVEKLKKKQ